MTNGVRCQSRQRFKQWQVNGWEGICMDLGGFTGADLGKREREGPKEVPGGATANDQSGFVTGVPNGESAAFRGSIYLTSPHHHELSDPSSTDQPVPSTNSLLWLADCLLDDEQ